MKQIDAYKLVCPTPVLLAKKAVDEGEAEIAVRVDNEAAVQNLTRFAASREFLANAKAIDGGFEVTLKKREDSNATASAPEQASARGIGSEGCTTAVFVGKDVVGDGDRQLGQQLMKMFLYTLSQGDDVPAYLLFMNAGVKLTALGEEQVIESIKTLIERGCEVLVCGACLNFYGITDALKAGTVSNMYEIVSRMQAAQKVITV